VSTTPTQAALNALPVIKHLLETVTQPTDPKEAERLFALTIDQGTRLPEILAALKSLLETETDEARDLALVELSHAGIFTNVKMSINNFQPPEGWVRVYHGQVQKGDFIGATGAYAQGSLKKPVLASSFIFRRPPAKRGPKPKVQPIG
jgi:hypothetical protein